jgi:hypothetical protein
MNVSGLNLLLYGQLWQGRANRHNVNSVQNCFPGGDCLGGKPYESGSTRPLFPEGEEGVCEVLSIWILT